MKKEPMKEILENVLQVEITLKNSDINSFSSYYTGLKITGQV